MLLSTWKANRVGDTPEDNSFLQDLIYFNQILHPERALQYHYAQSQRIDTTQFDTLTGQEDVPYILYWQVPVNQNGIAQAVEDIRHAVQNYPDSEIYEYISTALAKPRMLFKVARVHNTFIIFYNTGTPAYRSLLAAMLIEQKTNMDLVTRITNAIQHDRALTFSPEEATQLSEYRKHLQRAVIDDAILTSLRRTILKPMDFSGKIDSLRSKIEELLQRIADYQAQLKDTLMKEFAAKHGMDGQSAETELIDYLLQARSNNIHYAFESSGELCIGLWSYLVLTQDVDNYIKAARTSSGHDLFGYPRIVRLLEDVMQGNLRIQIAGAFHIRKDSNGRWNIYGTSLERRSITGRVDLVNKHITEYNCFNEGKIRMTKALERGDYIALFEQLFETTSSINVYDSTVMAKIVRNLKDMSKTTPLQLRTPEGWINLTLEEYYATITS